MNKLLPVDSKQAELRREICAAALDTLMRGEAGVLAATVSTVDGLEIAAAGAIAHTEAGKLAAITSSLQALGIAVTAELDFASLESIVVEARGGRLLCIEIALLDTTVILAAVAAKETLLARSLIATRDCALHIAAYWAESSTGPKVVPDIFL